tara:strand:- start:6 stop:116 length:111 start_codon:yes stop_codon:yes gene_type:complete
MKCPNLPLDNEIREGMKFATSPLHEAKYKETKKISD